MPAAIPKFNLTDVERRRDRIVREVFTERTNMLVDGPILTELIEALRRRLLKGTSRDVLFESIRGLAGQTLTAQVAMKTAWRLAGNMQRLRAGRAVPPWTTQTENEWVPLHILRCTPSRNQKGDTGYTFTFRALAGSCCPMLLRTFWPTSMVRFVAMHIGFSRQFNTKYPFHKAPELVGLRLLGELDAPKSRFEPVFWGLEFPPSFVQWNKDVVLQQRLRITPCPRGYTAPCRNCVVGYDECVGATHKFTYEQRPCMSCGETAWFDPELGFERCVQCAHHQLMKKT